jgi:hypothetical protein
MKKKERGKTRSFCFYRVAEDRSTENTRMPLPNRPIPDYVPAFSNTLESSKLSGSLCSFFREKTL